MSSVGQYNIEIHFSCDVPRLAYNMYLTIINHTLSIIETNDLIQIIIQFKLIESDLKLTW